MLFYTVAILAAIAIVVVLFLGVRSMALGGTYDRRHSGQLMSARIGLQLVAVALVILAVFLVVR